MKPGLLLSLAAACCIAEAAPSAAEPAPAAAKASVAGNVGSTGPASAPAAVTVAVPTPDTGVTTLPPPAAASTAAAAPTAPATPAPTAAPAPTAPMAPAAPSASGSLLQTVLSLGFVLALLVALAWVMKRYGPRPGGGNAALRLVGSLSLGGRERIMVIEVADQWIVVGASPGRVNALATLPRQVEVADLLKQQNGLATANFSEWLKQTIEKRNGK